MGGLTPGYCCAAGYFFCSLASRCSAIGHSLRPHPRHRNRGNSTSKVASVRGLWPMVRRKA
eukprot:2801867-Prymnesium_polylepis.1